MVRYVLKRVLLLIPIAIGVSLAVLIIIGLTPGMKADTAGIGNTLLGKCYRFISRAAVGDLGRSLLTGNAISKDIALRFPYTLFISMLSVIIAVLIGVPLGVYSATRYYSWKDRFSVVSSVFFISVPDFLIAIILISIFSVKLRWLPVFGAENWKGWILPVLSLSLGFTASITRQTRSSMLEQLRQGYILTARAKGQSEVKVIFRHALKNALIPIMLTIGTMFGLSLSGVFIMEWVFSLPGLGVYSLSAVMLRDITALQGVTLYMAIVYSIVIIVIDVAFALANPHIRSQYRKNS